MKKKTSFPCAIMRGGTSKGIFLREEELPDDPELRDRIILAIFGSPDIRQIDGLGGADSLTSKLALISAPDGKDYDVNYTFGAVGIPEPFIDYIPNCGNISAAVGPFAIEEGLVRAQEPFTEVRILNTNTGKIIIARVPVRKKKVVYDGDYAIDGVPGTGARINLTFMDPGGAATGKLLPTGNVRDEITLAGGKTYAVTIVDAGNPAAFVQAKELGLTGTELPASFDQDSRIKGRLESIRARVGEMIGCPGNPSIPKVVFVSPAHDYETTTKAMVKAQDIDFVARTMAMGKMHKTFPITGSIPSAVAALIPGSTVEEIIDRGRKSEGRITIGHPSGTLDIAAEMGEKEEQLCVISCTVGRTARRIMDGRVYVPERVYF
jgi:2-methylaconitate cis-trans-isomerase PrpF